MMMSDIEADPENRISIGYSSSATPRPKLYYDVDTPHLHAHVAPEFSESSLLLQHTPPTYLFNPVEETGKFKAKNETTDDMKRCTRKQQNATKQLVKLPNAVPDLATVCRSFIMWMHEFLQESNTATAPT